MRASLLAMALVLFALAAWRLSTLAPKRFTPLAPVPELSTARAREAREVTTPNLVSPSTPTAREAVGPVLPHAPPRRGDAEEPDGTAAPLWLEVLDARTRERIEDHVTVTILPQGVAPHRQGSPSAGPAWERRDTLAPVLLPRAFEGHVMLVRAKGFAEATSALLPGDLRSGEFRPGPGAVLVVELEPLPERALDVQLVLPEAFPSFEVRVFDGSRLVAARRPGAGTLFELEAESRVRVALTRSQPFGRSSTLWQQVVELHPVGVTTVVARLDETAEALSKGALAVTLQSSVDLDEIGTWTVRLHPVRASFAELLEAEVNSSRLSEWAVTTPRRAFARRFAEVAVGDHVLAFAPLALLLPVTVRAGEETVVEVELPELARLRVRPEFIPERGAPSGSPGPLLWRLVDATARRVDGLDPEEALSDPASFLTEESMRGRTHSVPFRDGFWEILTVPGVEIVLEDVFGSLSSAGNAVWRVEPTRLSTVSGPVEVRLPIRRQ